MHLRVHCRHRVTDEQATDAVEAVVEKLEEVKIQDFGEQGARSGNEDEDKKALGVEALRSTRECNAFVGALHRYADQPHIDKCPVCGGGVCLGCRAAVVDPEDEHYECNPPTPLSARFKGLRCGRDYQLCPRRGLSVALRDGCNHMTCVAPTCGCPFCVSSVISAPDCVWLEMC